MDIFDEVIIVVTGTEDGKNFVEEFLDKEELEMWVSYRKIIFSCFGDTVAQR